MFTNMAGNMFFIDPWVVVPTQNVHGRGQAGKFHK